MASLPVAKSEPMPPLAKDGRTHVRVSPDVCVFLQSLTLQLSTLMLRTAQDARLLSRGQILRLLLAHHGYITLETDLEHARLDALRSTILSCGQLEDGPRACATSTMPGNASEVTGA